MDALFEQLSALGGMALDGRGLDPAQLDGVLALFEGEAHASWAAAAAEHEAVARGTEAAAKAAQGHLDAVMDAAVGKYRGSSGEADALSAATAAMEMAFKASSKTETLAPEVFRPPPNAVAPRRRAPPAADADAASSSRGPGDDGPTHRGGRAGVSPEAGGVRPSEQARKALSLRSPFDGEEAAARDPLLPARVARWAGLGDVRKKHKKAQQQPEPPPAAAVEQPKASAHTIWDQIEPYFREITLQDIEEFAPKPPFSSNRLDPCFLIPFLGSVKELGEDSDPSDVAVVAENSNSNLIVDKDNEELENNIVRSKPDAALESSAVVGGNTELISINGTTEEHCEQDMQEVILQQEEQPVEIPLDQGRNDAAVVPEHREDPDTSLNWLLGARGRFVLTSERPNKKRKLLGADAGLERLVLLPPLQVDAGASCDVCCLGDSGTASNMMLHCSSCEVRVHQKCYGVHAVPDGYWSCAWCDSVRLAQRLAPGEASRTSLMPCVLCPKEKGALKPVKGEPGQTGDMDDLKFAHLFCSLWAPEVLVEDMESMEPVTNIGHIQENRTKMLCGLCKVLHGACVRCSYGTCRACFHPICARESKHRMEIWGKSGHNNVELRAFCSKHSTDRGIGSVHNSNHGIEQDATHVKLDGSNLITERKQLRFTRKNKDEFTINTAISSSSSSLNQVQPAELVASPSTLRSVETQEVQHTDMVVDGPTGDGNIMSNSNDVSTVLRKLIDEGKVSDIESELGLSSESLEAALVPETTTFSPGLKLKIIKLLQNSDHVPSVQVDSLREGSLAPQGTVLRSETKNLTDSQLFSELEEGMSSFDHCFPEGDKAYKDWADSAENCFHKCHDCDEDQISSQRFLNIDGHRWYIHPFIEKMLRNWRHSMLNQNKRATYCHEVSGPPHDQILGGGSSKEFEELINIAAADHASKAESLGILEHSPHDEIEGEIVYLQSRLLNNVVATKPRYEDFILKVVQILSHDLDSFNKRKWDHIIVNQFLRDIREAKKRGNTERRHKEAQAILAAAAPSVICTPRNPTVRKEAESDVIPAKQENIPKLITGSPRVIKLTSLPQSKDPSCSSNKVSAETNLGVFDLAKFSKKNGMLCDVCMRCETVLNRIFVCASCKAAVHLDCYQSLANPTGPWTCELCQEMLSAGVISGSQSDCSVAKSCLVQCGLCHGTSGAFRKTTKEQWVHAFCAEWLLESTFTRGQYKQVDGMESLLKGEDTCSICHHNVGACLKCSTVDCQITFHPACAKDAGLHMNTKKFGRVLLHKAYCGKHSIEQRKVDSQQYGPVEVRIMKQMRVELERLRLLCERVVKREREKKDLVVCEHDILGARRNTVAYFIRNPYAPGPGASSESATTSVNNNSYGGKMQRLDDVTVRSDDVTVDSNISRRHTVKFSVHSRETDRTTADSSTSTLSCKRKLDEGDEHADKKLTEKAAIAASKKSEDGETKPTDKKHADSFQKGPAMASDQVLLQNQQPPKLVYSRRGPHSKNKQQSRDVVEGPGG